MRWLWVVLRAAAAVAVLVAVVATYATAMQPVSVWNFFGFFTIQSNIIIAGALGAGAAEMARGRLARPLVRGAATVYIALTGVVYNTLLVGLAGGVALPWANFVLHSLVPAYAVIDWVLVPDRPALPWRRLWVVLPYPLVWLAVVLVRGATDGWVPYPFLNPTTGYPSVAAYCAAIAIAVLAFSAIIWGISRLHLPLASGSAASRSAASGRARIPPP